MRSESGIAKSVVFAAAISVTMTIVLAALPRTEIDPGINDQSLILPVTNRFWGKNSHVPDWRQAETIDEQSSRRFLTHYWPKLRAPEWNQESEFAPVGAKPDVKVFFTDYWRSISPSHNSAETTATGSAVTVNAALGESEPIAFGIRSDRYTHFVSVQPSALVSAADGNASNIFVTNRLMAPYPARVNPGRRPSEIAEQPMVLIKPIDNQWRLMPKKTIVYVVDFHVPLDAVPGRYHGEINIVIDEHTDLSISVSLIVAPFRLKTNGFFAGAFGTTYNIWEGGFSGYTEAMIEMDSRYGFNLAGAFYNKGNELPFKKHSRYELDIDPSHEKFHKFNQTMSTMKRYGMGDVAFWNWGASGDVQQFNRVLRYAGYSRIDTRDGKRGFAAICAGIKRAEKYYEWPEFIINPYDEALKDQDGVREIIRSLPFLRIASPDTRLYMTEWREGYSRLYQSDGRHLRGSKRPRKKEFNATLNSEHRPTLNFAVIGANTLSQAGRELQSRLGGEFWHYGGASRLSANSRLTFGFIPWAVQADAAMVWANYKGTFNGEGWTVHYPMPLDPNGRKNRNTAGPVVASASAIAVREGIDDRKYIETLRYYAVMHNSKADLTFLQNLSEKLREQVPNIRKVGGLENIAVLFSNNESMDRFRALIRDRIENLIATRGKRAELSEAVYHQSISTQAGTKRDVVGTVYDISNRATNIAISSSLRP